MSEMVERAKVAALVALAEHGKTTDLQEALTHGNNGIPPGAIDKMVRAVLQAMRTPTGAMCEAGANELFASVEQDWNEDAKRIYTAMLTAALGDDHG